MLVRLGAMLGLAALSALAWACASLALGLPLGITVTGAALGAGGGLLAGAICRAGARADEQDAAEPVAREAEVVAVVRDDRFSREEAPTRGRVA